MTNQAIATNRFGNPLWQPGHSPNPGGRPKRSEEEKELRKLCNMKALQACPKALGRLIDIAFDEGAAVKYQLQALSALLDRGLGKAAQSVEFIDTSNQNKLPANMTTQELMLAKSDVISAKMDGIKQEFMQHWKDGKMEELAKSWGM